MDIETLTSTPIAVKRSCPVCAGKLPPNINDIYCSASSVVKVAIRRLRKARLLLDLQASREVRRLRATVELVLNPDCSCSPLDTPGSLALLVNKDNDFLASGEHKQILSESFSIYGLPSIGGVHRKIMEARSSCSSQDKDQSTYVEPPAGG